MEQWPAGSVKQKSPSVTSKGNKSWEITRWQGISTGTAGSSPTVAPLQQSSTDTPGRARQGRSTQVRPGWAGDREPCRPWTIKPMVWVLLQRHPEWNEISWDACRPAQRQQHSRGDTLRGSGQGLLGKQVEDNIKTYVNIKKIFKW